VTLLPTMIFDTPFESYKLERIPKNQKNNLQAWDAADELLLHHIFENNLDNLSTNDLNTISQTPILVINDSFGALSLALHQFEVHNWTDSYISHLAAQDNLKLNHLKKDIKCIPSTEKLEDTYKIVLIKIPKTLALLEEQLCHVKLHITNDTIIIASAMSKHIHTSTLKLFEKIIGTTSTSRATKKARLIFSENNQQQSHQSPYPKVITDQSLKLELINHANVFSKDHLDIGSRFFIEQFNKCPSANNIIDLGCGNGTLGIMMQRYQPEAHIHFIDESYMAVTSAKESYQKTNSILNANFYTSNCLDQYTGERPDLIVCNPPFHQAHSIGDQIAWQMFKQSYDKLKKGGELWIVGNRHLGYHIKLKRLFGSIRTIASNKKFVILAARKAR